jgi:hypothetical protein
VSCRPRYIDLLCRGVVKGVVVFTQRPVLVRGELRWKVRVWCGLCVLRVADFAHRRFADWLTGSWRIEDRGVLKERSVTEI